MSVHSAGKFLDCFPPIPRSRPQIAGPLFAVYTDAMRVSELPRPSPERLLKQVQAEENKRWGAKLKLFLGYAPGVGKSYRMLDEARRRHERGEDVAVGAVQGQQSEEVQAILRKLETIPPLQTSDRPTHPLPGCLSGRAPQFQAD